MAQPQSKPMPAWDKALNSGERNKRLREEMPPTSDRATKCRRFRLVGGPVPLGAYTLINDALKELHRDGIIDRIERGRGRSPLWRLSEKGKAAADRKTKTELITKKEDDMPSVTSRSTRCLSQDCKGEGWAPPGKRYCSLHCMPPVNVASLARFDGAAATPPPPSEDCVSNLPAQAAAALGTITTRIINLTPELAADLLANTGINRPLKKKCIATHAKEIRSGRWVLNGESIKTDINGKLIDGQHRCAAVVLTKISIPILLSENCPLDAFQTLDQQAVRSLTDVLGVQGTRERSITASAARFLWLHEESEGTFNHRGRKATNKELVTFIESLGDIETSVKFARAASKVVPAGIACGLHILFSKIDQKKADYMMECLAEGGGENGCPVRAVRDRLLTGRVAYPRMPRKERIAIMILSWNKLIVGEHVQKIVWFQNKEFPKIRGNNERLNNMPS